jgi:hypothetical protein
MLPEEAVIDNSIFSSGFEIPRMLNLTDFSFSKLTRICLAPFNPSIPSFFLTPKINELTNFVLPTSSFLNFSI